MIVFSMTKYKIGKTKGGLGAIMTTVMKLNSEPISELAIAVKHRKFKFHRVR
jgi:hypothetical protein